MSSVAEDLANALHENPAVRLLGYAYNRFSGEEEVEDRLLTAGETLFAHEHPPVESFRTQFADQTIVVLFDTGGDGEILAGSGHLSRTVQIGAWSRYPRYSAQAAVAIARYFTAPADPPLTPAVGRYIGLWWQSGPLMAGIDTNDRFLCTVNLRAEQQLT